MADDPLAKLGVPAFGSPSSPAADSIPAPASTKTADPLASIGVPAFGAPVSSSDVPSVGAHAGGLATRRNAQAQPGITPEARKTAADNPDPVTGQPRNLLGIAWLGKAAQKIQELKDMTQDEKIQHPMKGALGDAVNKIEGFLIGNEEHPEAAIGTGKYGMITNPVTGLILPAGEAGSVAAQTTEAAGRGVEEGAQAVKGAGQEAVSNLKNPFRQVVEGKGVAQAPAQTAVREGVSAAGTPVSAGTPLVSGNQTILDSTIGDISQQAKSAYKQVDDVVGFDLKAEKQALANDQYKIKQLGNTPADKAAREATQAAIEDSTRRIAIAEAKLKAANVDPAVADQLFTKQKAAETMRNVIARNTAPDGTVKIDSLVRQSQALRFTKYGDRLEQLMGKQAAQQYMEDLLAAQKAGIHAMRVQRVALWTAGLLGLGTVGEVAKHLVGSAAAAASAIP